MDTEEDDLMCIQNSARSRLLVPHC